VRGDLVESVQRGPVSAELQRGARIVDLSTYTVLPGLMDCHEHIAGSPGDGGDTQMLQETDAHQALWGALHAKITLDAGFTTIRNVGSGSYAEVALKRFINQGLFPGPRIYTATKGISTAGAPRSRCAAMPRSWTASRTCVTRSASKSSSEPT
jgi:imidazolonepropionase-like amidohydrolase